MISVAGALARLLAPPYDRTMRVAAARRVLEAFIPPEALAAVAESVVGEIEEADQIWGRVAEDMQHADRVFGAGNDE